MQTIYYDDGGCGTGKTHRALHRIANKGGKHLFVVDRREAMTERTRLLRELAWDGPPIRIRCIASSDDRTAVQRGVKAQVEDAAAEHADEDNVVVFITHEAMRMVGFEAFAEQDWSIWIDEVPSVIDNESHSFFIAWEKLRDFYDLEPVDETWSLVSRRDPDLDVAALANCEAFELLRPFHRRVCSASRKVLVNVREWGELAEKGRQLTWYSVWSPDQLGPFDAIYMLGNALTASMTFRIWQEVCPEIRWEPMPRKAIEFRHRRAVIHYFAEEHVASRALFQTPEGQRNLRKASEWIAERVPPDQHIWMRNEHTAPLVVALNGCGTRLSPMKAGSNAYDYATHVTCLYSAKPAPALRSVYRHIGVDPAYHVHSAEYETINQFVCRGSIRNPRDDRDIHIYVYDRKQAEYLLSYFGRDPRRYVWAELDAVDLGFIREEHCSKPGPKVQRLSAAEQADAELRRKAKDAQRKREERAAKKAAAARPMINTSVGLQP